MLVAWLPGAVAWQPYGPFARPAVPTLSPSFLVPGFARSMNAAQSSSNAFPVGLSQWEPVESVIRASVSTY